MARDAGRSEREKRTMMVRTKNMDEYCRRMLLSACMISNGAGVGYKSARSFMEGRPCKVESVRKILEFLGMTPAEALGKGLLEKI
jgi:hypothetical protein